MRPFSDNEKEMLKKAVLDRGEYYFEKYGVDKASIRMIAKDVGISVGTFYNLFQSKEYLFLKVLVQNEQKVEKMVLEKFMNMPLGNAKELKKTIFEVFKIYKESVFMDLFKNDNYSTVRKVISPEIIEKGYEEDVVFLSKVYSIINRKVKLRELTEEEFKNLTGLIRITIYPLLIDNADINDESDKVLELYCDMLVKYVAL